MKYVCLRCGLDFKQRGHLENHLNRKNICLPILEPLSIEYIKKYYGFEKNNNMVEKVTPNDPKMTLNDPKMTPNDPKMTPSDFGQVTPNDPKNGVTFDQGDPKMTPNDPKMTPKWDHLNVKSKISSKNDKIYQCEFCSKIYSKNCHLRRHEKNCKYKYDSNQKIIEEQEKKILEMKEEHNKEILELKEAVKNLMTISDKNIINNNNNTTNNTNNTNCNNTNNIVNNTININNYGCENKDYITKDYLVKLLKAPFQAIPKLIEYTHFNKDHPENQNIKLPNKKQPYVKVLKGDKWVYVDRKSTILDLIDEKHCELNENPLIKHIEEKFSESLKDRFERFNDRYLNDEKEFANQLYKETELVMINNS